MSGSCIHIFLLLTLMLLPLAWIAGLIVSSFLAVGSLVGTLKRVAQRAAHRLTADQTPHRLDAIRKRCQNCRCLNYLAPGVLFGANGQPGSMAIGNILMLLMKALTAQGGNAFSFPHLGHYQSGPPTLPHCANGMYFFLSPELKSIETSPFAAFLYFPEDNSPAVFV
jgi:hypothetical protein